MSNPSVQLYSVRQEFSDDPQGTLRRIAEIGFRQVEPYGLVDHRAALEKALSAQQLTASTAHIKLVGADQVMLGTDYPFPLGELEPGKLIDSMPYDDSIKQMLLNGAALNWLNLDNNSFI